MIAGNFETEFGELIENVHVANMEMVNELQVDYMAEHGSYVFNNNVDNLDYSVTADKNDDPLNGVSTFDLVLISQHNIAQQFV